MQSYKYVIIVINNKTDFHLADGPLLKDFVKREMLDFKEVD